MGQENAKMVKRFTFIKALKGGSLYQRNLDGVTGYMMHISPSSDIYPNQFIDYSCYQLSHPNLAKVLDYGLINDDFFCSSSLTYYVVFKYYEETLEKQIALRNKNKFTESELFTMLEGIVDCYSKMEEIGMYDMIPSIELLSLDQGQLIQLAYGPISSYLNKFKKYLSPLHQKLENTKSSIPLNKSHMKEEVFELGMIFLYLGSLVDCSSCYKPQKQGFMIEEGEIIKFLEEIKLIYSSQFVEILSDMLHIETRPNFRELNNRLKLIKKQKLENIFNEELLNTPPSSILQVEDASDIQFQQFNGEYKPNEVNLEINETTQQKNNLETEINQVVVIQEKGEEENQQNYLQKERTNNVSINSKQKIESENYNKIQEMINKLSKDQQLMESLIDKQQNGQQNQIHQFSHLRQFSPTVQLHHRKSYEITHPDQISNQYNIQTLELLIEQQQQQIQQMIDSINTFQPKQKQQLLNSFGVKDQNIKVFDQQDQEKNQLLQQQLEKDNLKSQFIEKTQTYQNFEQKQFSQQDFQSEHSSPYSKIKQMDIAPQEFESLCIKIIHFQNGAYYQGGYDRMKMNGRGVLYYQKGSIAYNGTWVDNQFHGQGTLYNNNPQKLPSYFTFEDFDTIENGWIKYEGNFENDHKTGYGKLYLTNGDVYQGQFVNDFIHGQGVYIKQNFQKFEGVWNQNKVEL